MIKKVISIIILVLWMMVIFGFSQSDGESSSSLSKTVTVKILNVLGATNPSDKLLENSIFVVRKFAHLTEYLILGILMHNVLRVFNIKHHFLISILFCMAFAFTDEFHQLFIDGRDGNIVDVSIDSLGALFGNLLYSLYYKLRYKDEKNN